MAEEEHCLVCDRPKSAHTPPDVNHQFSEDGQLRPLVADKPAAPARPSVVIGRLIGILLNKGLLTTDEVARLISEEG